MWLNVWVTAGMASSILIPKSGPLASLHGTDSAQVATLHHTMGYDAAPLERLSGAHRNGCCCAVTLVWASKIAWLGT